MRPVKLVPPQVTSPPAVTRLGSLWEVDGRPSTSHSLTCELPVGSEKAERDLRRDPLSTNFTGRENGQHYLHHRSTILINVTMSHFRLTV